MSAWEGRAGAITQALSRHVCDRLRLHLRSSLVLFSFQFYYFPFFIPPVPLFLSFLSFFRFRVLSLYNPLSAFSFSRTVSYHLLFSGPSVFWPLFCCRFFRLCIYRTSVYSYFRFFTRAKDAPWLGRILACFFFLFCARCTDGVVSSFITFYFSHKKSTVWYK